MAAGRTAPLKSFLLDQSGSPGVGNIYADEALFRARLHPLSPAGSMKPEHLEALRDAVVAALEAGIDGGGASIDDYRDGRGEKGTMQDEFLVHTREGEPCPRCEGADRADRRLRALDLLLPELPGAAAQANPSRPHLQLRPKCLQQPSGRRSPLVCHGRNDDQDRGGGAAQHPLRRGRPHPPPLLEDAGPDRRDREGRAASRSRASAAGWSPSSASIWCCTKAAASCSRLPTSPPLDGYPRLRSSGPRSTPAPAPATRCCACSTRPSPTRPPTTCSAATSRCSTTRRRRAGSLETALSFRLKLALAAGFAPELASCARCGEARAPERLLRRRRGRRLRQLRSGLLPLSEEAHRFMVGAIGSPLAEAPAAERAGAAPGRARRGRDARAPCARPAAGRGRG